MGSASEYTRRGLRGARHISLGVAQMHCQTSIHLSQISIHTGAVTHSSALIIFSNTLLDRQKPGSLLLATFLSVFSLSVLLPYSA